jgi:ubiquinone/menaquinone biosynthesis C-methylase UbiE
MTNGIQYDEAWTQRVETIYSTTDVVAQRQAVLEGVAPQPGECIADLGAGPGMLAASLAAAVGPAGCVKGIDISESMVALARRRCAAQPWVEFTVGSVTALPYADGEFDAAVSTQVYEYVEF